jgi:hypothetical protein
VLARTRFRMKGTLPYRKPANSAHSVYALSLSGTGVKVTRLVLTIRMAPIGSALVILCLEAIGKDG